MYVEINCTVSSEAIAKHVLVQLVTNQTFQSHPLKHKQSVHKYQFIIAEAANLISYTT